MKTIFAKKTGIIVVCLALSLSAVPVGVYADEADPIQEDFFQQEITDAKVTELPQKPEEENLEIVVTDTDNEGAVDANQEVPLNAFEQTVTVETFPGAEDVAEERHAIEYMEEEAAEVAIMEEEFPKTQSADTATETVKTVVYKTGVYKVNGKYKYYENGRFSKKTGVVKRADNNKYVYVEKGVFKKITGVVKRLKDHKDVYVNKGVFQKKTGIAKRKKDGKYVYVKNGVFKKTTGLAKRISDGTWLYVKKGVLKKTSGRTVAIGNNSRILYFRNGKRVKSTKKFTGVYRGKCYKNNKYVDQFTKKDWLSFLDSASSQRALTITNGKIAKKKLAKLKKAMQKYAAATSSYGFIALNTKTGLMISYNPDHMVFGASTIKAPYIAALCKYKAPGLKKRKTHIHKALKYSSNHSYNVLFRKYGQVPINKLLKEAKVNSTIGDKGYRDTSARQLAKQWCVMKDYMEKDGKNVDLLRKNLLKHRKKGKVTDYYKKGWMYPGSWSGGILNCAGCGDYWVYGIVSSYGGSIPEARQDALISALASVIS